MTAQRVEELQGAAASRHVVLRRHGLWVVPLEAPSRRRRTPRVRPAVRWARRYFSSRRRAAELMQ
jgi:hypothetical protein